MIETLGSWGTMIVRKSGSDAAERSSSAPLNVDGLRTTMIDEPPDLPCRSEPVVDAVGAGDAFYSALTAYLSLGVDLEDVATMACGVESMSV